jgi:hypothetical protein
VRCAFLISVGTQNNEAIHTFEWDVEARGLGVSLTTPGLSASITSHSEVFVAAGTEKALFFATVRTA